MSRPGADLALLLLSGFRALVDAAMVELAARIANSWVGRKSS